MQNHNMLNNRPGNNQASRSNGKKARRRPNYKRIGIVAGVMLLAILAGLLPERPAGQRRRSGRGRRRPGQRTGQRHPARLPGNPGPGFGSSAPGGDHAGAHVRRRSAGSSHRPTGAGPGSGQPSGNAYWGSNCRQHRRHPRRRSSGRRPGQRQRRSAGYVDLQREGP